MGSKRQIVTDVKKIIINLHNKGLSCRKISEKVFVKKSAIATIIKTWKAMKSFANKPRCGRPKATTSATDRLIRRKALQDRGISSSTIASEVFSELGVKVSACTIRRRLNKMGLKGQTARKKPWLSKANIKKRLAWAKDHSSWTIDDWKKVTWSDESKFCLFGTDGVAYRWIGRGEALKNECLRKTVKHGGGE